MFCKSTFVLRNCALYFLPYFKKNLKFRNEKISRRFISIGKLNFVDKKSIEQKTYCRYSFLGLMIIFALREA